MIKRSLIFLLSILLLLNQVYVNAVTHNYYAHRNIDMELSSKNILFGSSIGGRSHLKPMLDLAAILIERGHSATLLTSGNYTPSSEYPTVRQIELGTPPIELKDIKDSKNIIREKFDAFKSSAMQDLSLKLYKNAFEKYKNAANDYNIDLFFCNIALNDACLDVAYTLKKPVVGFITFLTAFDQKTYKSDPMFNCKISLENESFLERFKCTVIQPLRMLYLTYPYIGQLNEIRNQINVEPVFRSLNRLSKTGLILIDTFFGYELPQTLPPNVQEVGPIISKEYPPLAPELSDFMNIHERVLYVGFGTRFFTTAENNNKILQSLIEVINKNIVDGVVWALVQTSKDNFYPTLNLTDGSQIQTSSILNNEHPHIRILNFVPQFTVLNHTNTKLFFSHGGHASVLESLYTGIPMIVLPLASDQEGNGQKLELVGVASSLDKTNLEVNDIVSKAEFLLKDENVKKNSKRMKVLAKINGKRKYRAADLIEYLLYRNNEGFNEEIKEWIPADARMGFIRGNNYDVFGVLLGIILGLFGGILWASIKLIGFSVKIIFPPSSQKPKRE